MSSQWLVAKIWAFGLGLYLYFQEMYMFLKDI